MKHYVCTSQVHKLIVLVKFDKEVNVGLVVSLLISWLNVSFSASKPSSIFSRLRPLIADWLANSGGGYPQIYRAIKSEHVSPTLSSQKEPWYPRQRCFTFCSKDPNLSKWYRVKQAGSSNEVRDLRGDVEINESRFTGCTCPLLWSKTSVCKDGNCNAKSMWAHCLE